ncbi:DNA helicase RecQ [Ferrimonas senticii]|uniref:DNA helicase RecQ n=1 Tax=Ferrimonas senticii TaxID=394566 RepID=UPI000409C814|nr:DNA helicase RecQ [Ferrimonas senticii]
MTDAAVAHTTAIAEQAQALLEQIYGYREFRSGQLQVIEQVVSGRDSLVIMPTGGGKSLCYQLPALLLPGLTVVISPLISLMKDQVDALKESGVAAAALNSSLDRQQVSELFSQISRGEIKLLYVSPERLMSLQQMLHQWPLSLVAVDEAHCISQWGHDFRPEYAQMGWIKQQLPHIPVMALTATADEATRQDIVNRLALVNPHKHLSSFDRPNIRYTVVDKLRPLAQLQQYLKSQQGNAGIIYCGSRRRVDELTEKLSAAGYKVGGYHAGMSADERAHTQEAFLRERLDIVVATVAFGMGINKSNVRYVVHWDLPKSIESYYQETGRAGRDGLESEALLLFDPADIARVRHLLDQAENGANPVDLHKLNAMAAFAEAQTCRRQVLLNYFNEPSHAACGNCDICTDPPKRYDGTIEAQKALSCVYRVGQRFGVGHVIEVLRGSSNSTVLDRGHDKLSTWGLGKEKSHDHWLSVFRQLIHHGLLQQDITRHSILLLTPAARAILKGERALELAEPRLALAKAPSRRSKALPQDYDRKLFAKLKSLRRTLADEAGKPPYVVFSDATLAEMAAEMPTRDFELLGISGVGETKLERYGEPFLNLIRDYVDS